MQAVLSCCARPSWIEPTHSSPHKQRRVGTNATAERGVHISAPPGNPTGGGIHSTEGGAKLAEQH